MGLTKELGRRIELLSMDPHFHDITIGLYRQEQDGRPQYIIHSYSRRDGVSGRIEFIQRTAKILGELKQDGDRLFFGCGSAHQAAARRVFLESCKIPSTATAEPKPLQVLDKRTGRNITAKSLGSGRYQISADGTEEGKADRVGSITAGLKKLAEMESVEGTQNQVAFPCGHTHDAVVGLLLPRALNVRAALREEEAGGARGMLVAPSQQK